VSVPVLLAAVAAFFFAAGNNLQRHAAAKVPHPGYGPVRLVIRLLGTPRWLLGISSAGLGLICQIHALPGGGVILVQSVIASTLVFSLLIEAAVERRRPAAVQLGGAVLIVIGITLLIRVGRPTAGDSPASLARLVPLWVTVAVVGIVALLRARYCPRGRCTAIVLGAAGGACFAIDAVFLRDFAEVVNTYNVVREAADVAGFAVTSIVGNLALQRGFHLAPLRHVLPAMSAIEPLAAFGCGWLVFGERLHAGPLGVVAVPAGLALMIMGVLACAQNPTRSPAPAAADQPRVRSFIQPRDDLHRAGALSAVSGPGLDEDRDLAS
jgi:drug/metabolite transporter (DMT)-like permease